MKKPKIAISLDRELLELVDSKVDNRTLRSRSQAIEHFLIKGLDEFKVNTVVLLIKGSHQNISLKNLKNKPLIQHQLEQFAQNNLTNIHIITQESEHTPEFKQALQNTQQNPNLHLIPAKHTADALFAIKKQINSDFLVWGGDIFAEFDIRKMIQKHLQQGKVGTIALMSRKNPSKYGVVLLEGDSVVGFQEKPDTAETFIVSGGIYLFSPRVFDQFNNPVSLEKDVFPELAKNNELTGFFMHGEYVHVDNN